MKAFVLAIILILGPTILVGCSGNISDAQARVKPARPATASSGPQADVRQPEKPTTAATQDGMPAVAESSSPPAESKTAAPTSEKQDTETTAPVQQASAKSVAPKSNTVHEISFDDLNCGMQADIVFRPWMLTDRVKELDGQRVRIAGYMHPDAKQKGITEFVLLRNTECKFGPSGQADHLIQVKLEKGVTTNYSINPIEVVGQLIFKPFTGPDGNTWSIYEMSGESVSALRRKLPTSKDSRPGSSKS